MMGFLRKEYLYLTLAQIFIGINIVLGKLLISEHSIYLILFLRFLIGLSCIMVFFVFNCKQVIMEMLCISKKTWTILFLQSVTGGFLFNVLILHGLKYTNALTTGIVSATIPASITILSFLILKEPLSNNKKTSVILSGFGILLLSLGKGMAAIESSESLGVLLVFSAILPEALFTIFSKMIKPIKTLISLIIFNFFNVILLLPFIVFNNSLASLSFKKIELLQVIFYGLSGGLLFFYFWGKGLKYATANTAAVFTGVMPVSTCALAFVFLGDSFTFFDFLGLIFVMLSIVIGTKKTEDEDLKYYDSKSFYNKNKLLNFNDFWAS